MLRSRFSLGCFVVVDKRVTFLHRTLFWHTNCSGTTRQFLNRSSNDYLMESLTAALLLEVSKSSQEFHRWADQQVDKLESSDSAFERSMEECECTLASLKENETQIENLRQQQYEIKMKQTQEYKLIEKEISEHQSALLQKQSLVKKLTDEKLREIQRLEELQKQELESQRLRERTLNDLTRGIRLYRFLGLEFEKADNGCMRFSFTQIDPSEPTRVFYFLLLVDSNDLYRLVDSNPKLDSRLCQDLTSRLNEDNNISAFAVRVRRAFRDLVLTTTHSTI